MSSRKTVFTRLITGLAALGLAGMASGPAMAQAPTSEPAVMAELPVKMVTGGLLSAVEAYFSPDGKWLIMQARKDTMEVNYHTYMVSVDGKEIRQINDKGTDACSYFFPDGKRIIWTSTKDNLQVAEGNFAAPDDYPTGSEFYVSNLHGKNVKRLTTNSYYDAEVSVSPDGKSVLFGRRKDGNMELWRMNTDGTEEFQITNTPDLQEGGAFYMADSKTIIYRAWNKADDGKRGIPMTIYTIQHDGTGLKQITTDPGTNWAPHPSPDGKHFVYVRVVGQGNYEVFLMNIETGQKTQVTNHPKFDGYPAFSPDGKTISFASSRDVPAGQRRFYIYTMDISALMDK